MVSVAVVERCGIVRREISDGWLWAWPAEVASLVARRWERGDGCRLGYWAGLLAGGRAAEAFGWWRAWAVLAEVASPLARRWEFLSWWRGMVSVVAGVGRCGWVDICSRWVLAYSWLVTGRSQTNSDEFFMDPFSSV